MLCLLFAAVSRVAVFHSQSSDLLIWGARIEGARGISNRLSDATFLGNVFPHIACQCKCPLIHVLRSSFLSKGLSAEQGAV